MKYLFEDPENARRMLAEMNSWAYPKTPFRQGSIAKGPQGGVDCLNLVAQCFIVFPAVTQIVFPPYQLDTSFHRPSTQLTDALDAHPWLEKIAEYDEDARDKPAVHELITGDIIGFRFGCSVWHLGLARGGNLQFLQCTSKAGVTMNWLDDPTYFRRVLTVHRCLAAPRA